MFQLRPILTNSLLVCFDVALISACYLMLLEPALTPSGEGSGARFLLQAGQVEGLFAVAAVWLAVLLYFGMYYSRRMDSVFSDLRIVAKSTLAGCLTLEILSWLFHVVQPARYFIEEFAVISFLTLAAARIGVRLSLRELRSRGHNVKNLVLVARPELGDRVAQKILRRAHYGFHILRRLDYSPANLQSNEGLLREFERALSCGGVDEVILGLPSEARSLSAQIVRECENRGINVRVVPDLYPLVQADTQVYNLDGIPLVNVRLYPAEKFRYVVLKRAFDIVVSSLVLVSLSPLYLIIAILIKLTSAGPVFFSQERVGLNSKRFSIFKFRTMLVDASRNSDTHWMRPDDPGVTLLGHFLRGSNLDELPQFFNVLRGDMSIVGPRPERPYFLEQFRQEIPDYMLRHYIKCGITGWAQVNGWRGDTSIRERLAYDLYYMRNWGLSLDLKILALTLTRSFFHDNAY